MPTVQQSSTFSSNVLTVEQLDDISTYIKTHFDDELRWPSWYIISHNEYADRTIVQVLVPANCKSAGTILQFKFENLEAYDD
jgi:hypothetical protein